MNHLFSVRCESCTSITDIRLGFSNRPKQDLAFACNECSQTIEITLILNPPRFDLDVHSANIVERSPLDFNDGTDFIDLHLDFPVFKSQYVMGMTPFLRAMVQSDHAAVTRHRQTTDWLNARPNAAKDLSTLLKHFKRNKIAAIRMNAPRLYNRSLRSEKRQDLILLLYECLGIAMLAFANPNQDLEASKLMRSYVAAGGSKRIDAMDAFIDDLNNNGYLERTQQRCLDIYPRVLKIETVLRPALFMTLTQFDAGDAAVPKLISTSHFEDIKDLYKDIVETASKLLPLVAGVNNVAKRGDHNAFLTGHYMTRNGVDRVPATLDVYASKDFGQKYEFIDDSFFPINSDSFAGQLRNAVGHDKIEYNEMTQLITYTPQKKGLKAGRADSLSLAEFTVEIVRAYREMHRMHHLLKSLLYYDLLAPHRQTAP
jgi:hypothetical protein